MGLGDERAGGPAQERPDEAAPEQPEGGEPAGRGGRATLDLSVPQVAGSAVAAVVAAKLASNLGVYGTIMGAGVVSVLGTCGGSILQHVFRRTGRHVHEVAGHVHGAAFQGRAKPSLTATATETAARTGLLSAPSLRKDPRPRTDPDPATAHTVFAPPTDTPPDAPGQAPQPHPDPATAHTVFAPPTPTPPDAPGQAPATALHGAAQPQPSTGPDPADGDGDGEPGGERTDGATRVYGTLDATAAASLEALSTGHLDPPADTAYSEGTVHRAGGGRGRRWKRPAVAVALAFGLTMGGITVVELASGQNISGHGSGTTIGNAFTGGSSSHSTTTPTPSTTGSPSTSGSGGGQDTTSPAPTATDPATGGTSTTAPSSPTPSATPSTGSTRTGGNASGSGGSTATTQPTPSATTSPPTSSSTDSGGGSGSGSSSGGSAMDRAAAPQQTP
ncbi:hypothetical protein [Actinacidiphila sp. bgisy145]|uniref:hypothetical protein n=1 Tax=Actinacidiphila sp. bgisy145 TaxID=3413792 RepID=UPI003EBD55F7